MTTARLLDHWSPPDGAGRPQACLATSFTFDAEFFTEDCLSRFLSLSSVRSESGDSSSIATLLEEEERLSEAHVTLLVDRSCDSEKRNLRWDLVPVTAPDGLLHAKAAVLLWEHAARVILGSANLTAAGYRRQVEVAFALDLHDGCEVPLDLLDDLNTELRRLVGLAPGPDDSGPKDRAIASLNLFAERVASLDLPRTSRRDLRLALAPSRPGHGPLGAYASVWRGPQPLWAAVLSPFWDDDAQGRAVNAIAGVLTGRGAEREVAFVVDVDPVTNVVRAPAALAKKHRVPSRVVAFTPPDDKEVRLLHAKCVLVESDTWLAAMVGSSNATIAGLGLDTTRGHEELNIWIGCPTKGSTAKQLRSLAQEGEEIDLDAAAVESLLDEDEVVGHVLPVGFESCLIHPGTPPKAILSFVPKGLPATWRIEDPAASTVLFDKPRWAVAGSPSEITVELPTTDLPSFLVVRWEDDDGGPAYATWTANVLDRSQLPPPAELKQLPVEVLLAALASTRPLPVALEAEWRRVKEAPEGEDRDPLDPLKRFDDSATLLHRSRRLSLSLYGLKQRLGRPASSLDTIDWRLRGVVGPVAIADGLVAAASNKKSLPGEAHFLLAELALTIASVDWDHAAGNLDRAAVRTLVHEVVDQLEERLDALGDPRNDALARYASDAFKKARS